MQKYLELHRTLYAGFQTYVVYSASVFGGRLPLTIVPHPTRITMQSQHFVIRHLFIRRVMASVEVRRRRVVLVFNNEEVSTLVQPR